MGVDPRLLNKGAALQGQGLALSSGGVFVPTIMPVAIGPEVTGIDATSVGDTIIFTVPASRKLLLVGAAARVSAASAITVGASVSIGTNNPTYDDLFADTPLTGVLAVDDGYLFWLAGGKFILVPSSTDVKFRVNTGATGTSQSLAVLPLGYLL